MTDTDDRAELRAFVRRMFGRDGQGGVDLSRPVARTGNAVPTEGTNPTTGPHFTREDHLRQMVRELWNPHLAATDPVTFEVNP